MCLECGIYRRAEHACFGAGTSAHVLTATKKSKGGADACSGSEDQQPAAARKKPSSRAQCHVHTWSGSSRRGRLPLLNNSINWSRRPDRAETATGDPRSNVQQQMLS